ncbi:MAG: hypothetical protein JNL84_07400 [Candidatus Accumulibacter sp.]|nr:hypothetical protein [Accumulibacter sp.]
MQAKAFPSILLIATSAVQAKSRSQSIGDYSSFGMLAVFLLSLLAAVAAAVGLVVCFALLFVWAIDGLLPKYRHKATLQNLAILCLAFPLAGQLFYTLAIVVADWVPGLRWIIELTYPSAQDALTNKGLEWTQVAWIKVTACLGLVGAAFSGIVIFLALNYSKGRR